MNAIDDEKFVKEYIEYVSAMIDRFKVLGELISKDDDVVTPERINTALAYYYQVSMALNSEYQRCKIEYLREKLLFQSWEDAIFEKAKKAILYENEQNSKTTKPSVKEYETRSRNDNRQEYNIRQMKLNVYESKMQFILRMMDTVKTYDNILVSLANNMRQEMRSLSIESRMNSYKDRDNIMDFPQAKRKLVE